MRNRRSHIGSLVSWFILLSTLIPAIWIASRLSAISEAIALFLLFVAIDLCLLRFLTGITPTGTKARIHFPAMPTFWGLPVVSIHQTPLQVLLIAYKRLTGQLAEKDKRKQVLQVIADDAVIAIVYALQCNFSAVLASSHLLNHPGGHKYLCDFVKERVGDVRIGEYQEKISWASRWILSLVSGVTFKEFPKTKRGLVFQLKLTSVVSGYGKH